MYTKCIDRKAHSGNSCTIQKVYKNVYFLYKQCVLFASTLVPKCILHKCTQGIQCDAYFNVLICIHFVSYFCVRES